MARSGSGDLYYFFQSSTTHVEPNDTKEQPNTTISPTSNATIFSRVEPYCDYLDPKHVAGLVQCLVTLPENHSENDKIEYLSAAYFDYVRVMETATPHQAKVYGALLPPLMKFLNLDPEVLIKISKEVIQAQENVRLQKKQMLIERFEQERTDNKSGYNFHCL